MLDAATLVLDVAAPEVWFWAGRSVVLLGFVWLAWRSPLLALLTWFVASPAGAYWVPRYNRIELGVIVLAFLLHELRKKTRWKKPELFEWLYGGWCVLIALHLIWLSQDPAYWFRLWLDAFVLPFGVYLIARERTEPEGFGGMRSALLLLGLLVAGCALIEQIARVDLLPSPQGLRSIYLNSPWLRVNGPYPDDVVLASIATFLLLFFLPAAFAPAEESAGRGRVLMRGVCLLLGLAVVFTFSRTFWGIVVVGGVTFLAATGKRFHRLALAGVLLAVLLAAALLYRQADSSEFLRERVLNPANLYGRVATYRTVWEMAREHPWTGVGFGNFTAAAWSRPAQPFRGVLPVDQPHSGYFLLLAETGLPGLALFLLAFGCVLRPAVSLFRRSPTAAGAGLAVGSFLAANLVFTLLLIPGVNHLVFLLLGILVGRHRSGAVGKPPG